MIMVSDQNQQLKPRNSTQVPLWKPCRGHKVCLFVCLLVGWLVGWLFDWLDSHDRVSLFNNSSFCETCCVAQTVLRFTAIHPPLPPEYWD